MIELSELPIFAENRTTLKEASKDDHDGVCAYMTESSCAAVDFDSVKDAYIRELKLTENPKSNDALFFCADGRLAFIEFKNGYMSRQKQFEVRKKIFDSLLIFCDIVGVGISVTRRQMDYILVYHEGKNPDKEPVDAKDGIQNSASRDQIAKKFMALGRQHYIKYGLEMFKNYCFQEVYTYTEQEFDEYFVKKRQPLG